MKVEIEQRSGNLNLLTKRSCRGELGYSTGDKTSLMTMSIAPKIHGVLNCDKAVFKGSCEIKDSSVQNKSVLKNSINTTAENNSSGRLSFKGAEIKAAKSFAEKVVTSKHFAGFLEFARKNPAVFEAAGAIGICCGLRPLTIMAMPKKDQDKNRKAASHSIASGLAGFVFAYVFYNHFSKAMSKIEKAWKEGNPEKYFVKGSEYITGAKGGLKSDTYKCFNQVVTYGPKTLTAFLLGAATVGVMPYIDRYIIDKYIIKPKKNAKPIEMNEFDTYRYITFRSKSDRENRVFQNFRGVMR